MVLQQLDQNLQFFQLALVIPDFLILFHQDIIKIALHQLDFFLLLGGQLFLELVIDLLDLAPDQYNLFVQFLHFLLLAKCGLRLNRWDLFLELTLQLLDFVEVSLAELGGFLLVFLLQLLDLSLLLLLKVVHLLQVGQLQLVLVV